MSVSTLRFRLPTPAGFVFSTTVGSHGWSDLPSFTTAPHRGKWSRLAFAHELASGRVESWHLKEKLAMAQAAAAAQAARA